MRFFSSSLFALCCVLTLSACAGSQQAEYGIERARAMIMPTSADGSDVRGTVTFNEVNGTLRITGTVSGLTPNSMHGFHLHQTGACGPADIDGDGMMEPGGAAGGHWDPLNTDNHDGPNEDFSDRHAGDLGNIQANSAGVATLNMAFPTLAVTGEYGVLGLAVMVHSDRDNLQQDPGGSAGTRIGCGVISEL
jgi:Cu-Zn family superoxide dismutase